MDFIEQTNIWLLYLALFIAPFVQEDSAVIGAASLSVSRSEHWISIFAVILAGLIASDSWKYWLGWAARHHQWAKKYADKPRVQALQNSILTHDFKTIFAVRFIPFARIPTYIAAGFFGVLYGRYWSAIALSALAFIAVIFTGFHLLGEMMGETLKHTMPIIALGFVAILVLWISGRHLLKSRPPH